MASSSIKITPNYQGLVDRKTTTNYEKILMDMAALGNLHPVRFFSIKYQVLPCVMTANICAYRQSNNITPAIAHTTRQVFFIIQYLIDQYKVNLNDAISNTYYIHEKKISYYTDIYIDLGDFVSVYLSGGQIYESELDNPLDLKPDLDEKVFFCINTITVYHVPQTTEQAQAMLDQLCRFKLFPITETSLQMVCYNPQSGFYTSSILIKRPLIKDLRLNYGDGFLEVHEKLLKRLCEADSTGITFLHGPPGTGKTYYIRYLINEIKEKSLIYVPPDLVTEMTKPGFLPFLMQYPNSILIIEDAENIILDRKDSINPNQAVSNLLNLSDGLLGDAMHQQIITTFNCEIKGIDPALLREGRLLVEHKFDKLSTENARRLSTELGIDGVDQIQSSMSLSEIYAKKTSSI
ncbi:unnamed protein product [Rotaria magnacalcarata]|uniref:ATPase AAA-type core domain-containing protein n=1 Tax=Rotaria magnacalcarata TaxID=392030 RepID=A0A815ZI01_9BILA|nr:unnamed protein product [Rotaria magnacalcarata]CAF2094471.1 unnamed protein product [Rotaria magnacalcarata]CAF2122695.1 unnamed protein product [Rotaria magnacalcarata]CAF2217064.1 unnamed protein product [Rotaria magnacalcarata]